VQWPQDLDGKVKVVELYVVNDYSQVCVFTSFSSRHMPAPRAICFACNSFLFFYFFNNRLSKALSGLTGLIFTKFSPCGRYLIID